MRSASPLALVVALTACASYRIARPAEPPASVLGAPPPGAARVCAIRQNYAGTGATMTVRDNGRLVGATRWGGAFCWLAAPGAHAIEVEAMEAAPVVKQTEGSFQEGGRYYLSEDVVFDGFFLDWIDETRAGRIMSRLEYQALVATPNGERVLSPPDIAPARSE